MTAFRIRRAVSSESGFTIIELLVASTIMLVVTAAVFELVNPAQGMFQTQPEASDLQQRLRVGVDSVQKDLVMAGAGTYAGESAGALSYFIAPIMPYVAFGDATDPSKNVFFRDDVIALVYVPPTPSQTTISQAMPPQSVEMKVNSQPNCPPEKGYELCGFSKGDRAIIFDESGNWDMFTITEVQAPALHMQHRDDAFSVGYSANSALTQIVTAMYYYKPDTLQLMYFDGWDTDLPVVDNVVKLQFQYFGEPQPPQLTGRPLTSKPGPWTTYGPVPPELGIVKGGYPAGENCTFKIQAGTQVPRLPVLGAGGIAQVELKQADLTDGPWCPDPAKPNKFDADLLRIRRVRVTLRVQAAQASMRGPAGPLFTKGGTSQGASRYLPDQEVTFDVTPRNMNLGR
jgi:prepilin-type N-terminal cleavage/methylation domain-containing protein